MLTVDDDAEAGGAGGRRRRQERKKKKKSHLALELTLRELVAADGADGARRRLLNGGPQPLGLVETTGGADVVWMTRASWRLLIAVMLLTFVVVVVHLSVDVNYKSEASDQ